MNDDLVIQLRHWAKWWSEINIAKNTDRIDVLEEAVNQFVDVARKAADALEKK